MPVYDVSAVATKIYSIGIKARMLAEWVRVHRPSQEKLSSRQVFMMELILGYPPITRKSLGIIFGMSASSVSDTIRELVNEGLVAEETVAAGSDAREKPLKLTDLGTRTLQALKEREAIRYRYLFDSVSVEEWQGLGPILDKIDLAAKRQVDEMIFGK